MKRARHGAREENVDRLSDLPDSILLHMLAFLDTKYVVQTCVLSKRWKDLWKHVPALLLHSSQFWRVASFSKFVAKVLSCRDGSIALCYLDFERSGRVEPHILKRIVRYAVSHNVQQLRIDVEYDLDLPPAIFSCQSLTSLELSIHRKSGCTSLFPKSLSMTALTNLHLKNFAFCPSDDGRAEPFSNCKMLHTLVLVDCTVRDAQALCISNARVANLTMHGSCYSDDKGFKIVLSTPNLRVFSFRSCEPQELFASNLCLLEEVCIDISWPFCKKSALMINSWLQLFTDLKSITLSCGTLEVLSSIPELWNRKSSCSDNLNSSKVQFKIPLTERKVKLKPSSSLYGIVHYLLQHSPSAEVTFMVC